MTAKGLVQQSYIPHSPFETRFDDEHENQKAVVAAPVRPVFGFRSLAGAPDSYFASRKELRQSKHSERSD